MARRPGGEAAIRARLAASPGLSHGEAHTLAGLLDGESHLAIAPNNGGAGWRCECSVNLRDDDREILINYRDKLGLGHLAPEPWSPAALWLVTGTRDVLKGIGIFELERLHGRENAGYRAAVVRRLRGLLDYA
jgi:hypothetical protein